MISQVIARLAAYRKLTAEIDSRYSDNRTLLLQEAKYCFEKRLTQHGNIKADEPIRLSTTYGEIGENCDNHTPDNRCKF